MGGGGRRGINWAPSVNTCSYAKVQTKRNFALYFDKSCQNYMRSFSNVKARRSEYTHNFNIIILFHSDYAHTHTPTSWFRLFIIILLLLLNIRYIFIKLLFISHWRIGAHIFFACRLLIDSTEKWLYKKVWIIDLSAANNKYIIIVIWKERMCAPARVSCKCRFKFNGSVKKRNEENRVEISGKYICYVCVYFHAIFFCNKK